MRHQVLSVGRRRRALARLRSERGFTLIEMLVALAAGMVVMMALGMIELSTSDQTTREFSRIDSTSRAQVAIENLENQLHSACVTNTTPILAGSTPTTLQFVSQYGSGPTVTPVEDQVTFNSATGRLTEYQYQETGYTTDSNGQTVYTFSTTPIVTNGKTLLTNVSQTVIGGVSTPVFQYFAYQEPINTSTDQPYTDASGQPYMMLLDGTSEVPGTSVIPTASPLPDSPSLSSTNAATAAEVVITLTAGPQNYLGEALPAPGGNYVDDSDSVSDGVVLRLTPAPNYAGNGNVFLPCQ
jgi:prepilin-type N-terminal cleavage/methylation domain-containing protein